MKFLEVGGWFSGNRLDRVKAGAEYGLRGIEQLDGTGSVGCKAHPGKNGVTSTSIVVQSEKEEDNFYPFLFF